MNLGWLGLSGTTVSKINGESYSLRISQLFLILIWNRNYINLKITLYLIGHRIGWILCSHKKNLDFVNGLKLVFLGLQ